MLFIVITRIAAKSRDGIGGRFSLGKPDKVSESEATIANYRPLRSENSDILKGESCFGGH
ncbi:hypothetical protein SOASR029_21040 [Budvicia aquatica]|nr:hypothetical protein SOASR029_21040 [Budvicia aquatica]